ncbi:MULTISPECIES: PspA-associated protein PspAB [unclassified Streptomyces]|uniref:PspA-associated protein PspAB n=1 Tax=unclassified Streptomyces TaxID=2593676 RepID=UPI0033B8A90A
MGFLDILLGRTRPAQPDLDQLFGLPSAAVTLEAAAGFTPTGTGAVCFASVEGQAFAQAHEEVQALLDADAERTGPPVQVDRDEYGYSWLVSRRAPDDLPALVSDLHAVNSALEGSGFGPQLLCSVAAFETGPAGARRRLGLVYLYKRGTFYPFAPVPEGNQRRDNALELQVKAVLADDLRIEQDLSRWFPIWGAPGL